MFEHKYRSNLRAMKINCNILTAQKSSNSKDLSCLTLHMQIGMDIKLTKTKGTKTSTHKCLPDSKLSATRSSNMRSNKWVAKLINIALYWMYSSAFKWLWGRRHHTMEPTIAPDTENFVIILVKFESYILRKRTIVCWIKDCCSVSIHILASKLEILYPKIKLQK